MAPIVEIKELAKSYGSFEAVKGINFTIEEGEIFSLLGPNGAGKTTTISMLSCLIPPSRGDATVGGHSVVRDSLAVKKVIGVVPQDIALYDTLSGRENMMFWGRMYGLDGQKLKKRVEDLLIMINMTEKADKQIQTYSGGMKRRVNIAVGLIHSPRVLFLDEPTVGIDPQSRRSILDAVKELNREGLTVLYTTHYMEEAEELSNRVGIIDHGQLIAIGTQKELTHRYVGEKESLGLHIAEDQDPAAFAQMLRGVPGVLEVSAPMDHQVIVSVPQAKNALPAIITRAHELGIKIRSVDIKEPNLEAVFLQLTGRALRD